MKRYFLIGTLALMFIMGVPTAHVVHAADASLQAQISNLLLLIQDLQARITAIKAEKASAPAPVESSSPEPVRIVSPNTEGTFTLGSPIVIAWGGGRNKVQIGLIDARFDETPDVLGWIVLNGTPNGSFFWNGAEVSDVTGTISYPVASLSAGPYKIIAVSSGTTGRYCVEDLGDCDYDVSDAYFNLTLPPPSNIVASCTPSSSIVQSGQLMTWSAFASRGNAPYTYVWSGTDGISKLPTRASTKGQHLDLFYRDAGLKTAGVTVHDSIGQVTFVPCRTPVSVQPAPASVSLLSPNGGETLTLTRAWDASQFVKVSWALGNIQSVSEETMHIVLVDSIGRECEVSSTSAFNEEEYVGLVEGYVCPGSKWKLIPGRYKIKIYIEGREKTMVDYSDSYMTLLAPVEDVQAIKTTESTIDSGGTGTFQFTFPPNTVRATLFLYCPEGITVGSANTCNRYIDVLPYMASGAHMSLTFSNSSTELRDVVANFYVYLPNNPKYSRGVSTRLSVRPVSTAEIKPVTIIFPNGGEALTLGTTTILKFATTRYGNVDLKFIPYPAINADLVCDVAKNVQSSAGEASVVIPSDGACTQGPAKTLNGTYKVFATLKNDNVVLGYDVSDASFTVGATSAE